MVNDSNSSTFVKQLTLGTMIVNTPNNKGHSECGSGTVRTKFMPYQIPQLVILQSDISNLLPPNHFVYPLIKAVRQFDMSGILFKYEGKRRAGHHACDPSMMLALIFCCYHEGRTSSRAIEQMAKENIPCLLIVGGRTPDHDTIANLLSMHRHEFDRVFRQTVLMADKKSTRWHV
jgi:transposase